MATSATYVPLFTAMRGGRRGLTRRCVWRRCAVAPTQCALNVTETDPTPCVTNSTELLPCDFAAPTGLHAASVPPFPVFFSAPPFLTPMGHIFFLGRRMLGDGHLDAGGAHHAVHAVLRDRLFRDRLALPRRRPDRHDRRHLQEKVVGDPPRQRLGGRMNGRSIKDEGDGRGRRGPRPALGSRCAWGRPSLRRPV